MSARNGHTESLDLEIEGKGVRVEMRDGGAVMTVLQRFGPMHVLTANPSVLAQALRRIAAWLETPRG